MRQAIVSVLDEDAEALGIRDALDLFRSAGVRDMEVLSCEGARGVVRVTFEDELDEERLGDLPSVRWHERVAGAESGVAYIVEFDAGDSADVVAACTEELLLCRTVAVDDDGFTFDLSGSQAAITDTIARYEAAGASVGLEALREYRDRGRPLDALTGRQREVLEVAYEAGYFDVPRRASTREVAGELNLDPSTVSEHLQRAERNLLSTVLARPA